MAGFKLTAAQLRANELLASPATHIMLYGGSRSGKTFLELRAIAVRALKAPGSRHAALRFRFNAAKQSLAFDTWPKMMGLCFPGVPWELDKTDWYVRIGDGSEVWIGGLDDKERTEKVLGKEFATILLNECSQIPLSSRNLVVTRLAQSCMMRIDGRRGERLPLKMYYDENPPDKAHWSYRMFVQRIDPETKAPLAFPENYAVMRINPRDNAENLPPEYFRELESLSGRMRRRFLEGEFRESNPAALFPDEHLDRWRHDGQLPDMQRVVIGVDPSGSGDTDNADNDAIGIVVVGLGTDGNAYCLEDLTVKAGPATWGKIATGAYERHDADLIVAETNFGGAMVRQVIQTARRSTNFREVHASRGKVVRAEPFSALVENGKVRLAGRFNELEDELAGFTTSGYIGNESPNRADAFVWALAELFPGITRETAKVDISKYRKTQGIGIG